MRLRTVTVSGVDNQVAPERLLELQRLFPFVEWGILPSATTQGKPRYPTAAWIVGLGATARDGARLSGHLCGRWAKDACKGTFPADVDVSAFSRLQLNIAQHMEWVSAPEAMAVCLPPGREYILQVGPNVEAGLDLARRLRAAGVAASVLFDASGGHGITPQRWPNLPDDVPCGVAGGLGPENLEEQLGPLAAVAGDRLLWIDMESKVRSEADELDFDKVGQCLEIARRYVI